MRAFIQRGFSRSNEQTQGKIVNDCSVLVEHNTSPIGQPPPQVIYVPAYPAPMHPEVHQQQGDERTMSPYHMVAQETYTTIPRRRLSTIVTSFGPFVAEPDRQADSNSSSARQRPSGDSSNGAGPHQREFSSTTVPHEFLPGGVFAASQLRSAQSFHTQHSPQLPLSAVPTLHDITKTPPGQLGLN